MPYSFFSRLTWFIVLLVLPNVINAQLALEDVAEAFNSISNKPQALHLKNNFFKIPAGGHLQGIQALSASEIVLTGSSGSISYFITARLNGTSGKWEINGVQKISNSPYRHAGGCQINGDILIVGVEDNYQKDKARIMMVSFGDTENIRFAINGNYPITTLAERSGVTKRSTAGAVGFTKLKSGKNLIAVGDWDSRNIDFYLSRSWWGDLLSDSLTTFSVLQNKKWPSYQSINLLSDTAGNIYLIGFALDGVFNRADLFKVELQKDKVNLILCKTRNFKCKAGAGFRFGSGINVTPEGRITIYSCGRNASGRTPINIFR